MGVHSPQPATCLVQSCRWGESTQYKSHFHSKFMSMLCWYDVIGSKFNILPRVDQAWSTGEVLFPGLDLDSGLDWTLDWTHGLWLNSALEHSLKPV